MITVLMYHDVSLKNRKLTLYDVSFESFKTHMGYLKNLDGARPGGFLPGTSQYAVTFDDGYKSWANEVLDVLNAFNIKAYFFVCMKFFKKGSISKKDILKLKSNGMVIGSHGMTHKILTVLPHLSMFKELSDSKKMLEDITGGEIDCFSVPKGVYNRAVIEAAKRAGYKKVFTSDVGVNKSLSLAGGRVDSNKCFLVNRIVVRRGTSLSKFKNILNGKGINKMAFNQKVRNKLKGVLGINSYNWIRSKVVPRAE